MSRVAAVRNFCVLCENNIIPPENIILFPCEHSFHEKCLDKKMCPKCDPSEIWIKKSLKKKQVLPKLIILFLLDNLIFFF